MLSPFLTATALLLFAALYTDLVSGRIPNWLTMGFAGVGLVLHLGAGLTGADPWALGLYTGVGAWAKGFAAGGLVLFIPYIQRAAGGGDLKLFAAMGALTGPWAIFQVFLFACVAWGVLGLLIMAQTPLIAKLAISRPANASLRSEKILPFSLPAAIGFGIFAAGGGI